MAYGSSKVGVYEPIKRKSKQSSQKNNGGILGGTGYLVNSALAGIGGVGEGIVDLFSAAGAAISGDLEYAKYVFKDNDVGDWYESVTEEYNPDAVWKFGGDVAHGLGQSSWFLLNLIPGANWVGTAAFGAGMVGQGISGAAEQTGDVGLKEVGYGVTTAAIETTLGHFLSGTSTLAKNIGGSIAKSTGKSALKSVASSATRKGLVKSILTDAAGEFAEEFISEYTDTFLQRLYQINPDAETSLRDALYSGFVGAVSGAISAGSGDVVNAVSNQQRGARIIKNGNSQTLVNTATKVADKLAASGTDFKNAPQWVKTLRGEVDAYNALVKKGQSESISAQTILGEMQASLYFAETQAQAYGVQNAIMNADEADRAALAEYINQSFDKSKRKKDYTAEDVAKNTDDVATQLAVLKYVKIFDIDGAVAEAEIEAKIAEERGKATARAEQKSAESAPAMANEAAQAQNNASTVTPQAAQGEAVQSVERAPAMANEATQSVESGVRGGEAEILTTPINEETKIKADLNDDVADIEASATIIDDDIDRIRDNVRRAVTDIKVDGKFYELTNKHVNNIARGVQKYMRQGMSESDAIAKAVETRLVDIKSMGEESGVKHELGKATLQKVRGAVVNAYRAEMQNTTKDAAKKAQEARKVAEGTEAQKSAETSAEQKGDGKAARKSSEAKEKTSESTNKYTESAKSEAESGEPKINEAKESLTDEQRKEKARKRAEQMIEWEKKTAPTAKELNSAREYVKGFDNLSQARKASIVRMIRSADGKVDKKILKGLANLMAITPKADIEIRFAEGIGNKGLYTHVGNKALILLDPSANYKATIQGTIAHELVHYIENKAGYKEFADYVMKRVKPENREKVEKLYNEHYTEVYTAEAKSQGLVGDDIKKYVSDKMATKEHKARIESEVVAKYVGQALNNEKLLKKYADKDKKFIAKVGEWIAQKVKTMRSKEDVDPEAVKIAEDMANGIEILVYMPTLSEIESITKYDVTSSNKDSQSELSNEKNEYEVEKTENLSEDKESKVVDAKSEEEIQEELKAKKTIEAMFEDNVRMYSTAEFIRIFNRVKNISSETLGELLRDKGARIRGKDLGRIARDVQLAMYKASVDGDVGAKEAIKKIAEKAASIYVSQQTVFDEETKRHISFKKYIEDPEALKSYEDTLAEELFNEFAKAGKNLSNYRDAAFIQNKLEELKKKYFDYKDYTEYSKRASSNASDLRKLADMQKRAAADEGIRNLAKAIGSTVNSHGMIRWTKIDAVLAQISDFYNVDNAKMFGEDVTQMTLTEYAQVFDKEARSKIDRLLELRKERTGKPLTGAEMGLWADITGALRATINEYNGLYKDGKFFDRTKVATQLASSIVEYFGFGKGAKYKNKFLEGLSKSGLSLKEWYFYSAISPQTLIEGLEGYSHDGVLKSFYQSIQSATELKDKMVAELIMPFDNFLDSKDNRWKDDKGISRSYRNKLVKKKVNLFGTELYLGEAIYAFELCKREHAEAGLSKSGIKIYGEDGRQRAHIKEVDVELAKQELFKQFDETDKKYIEMVEKFFNETSTKIKRDSDYEYLGYTNVLSGHYIPIIRDRFARDGQTTDIRFSIRDITTIYNERFNQHITKNAKACEVINIQEMVSAHARGLADYANLYMPLKSFDRLYNSVVVLDDGRIATIRELLNDVWPQSQEYFRDLFGDIQGVPRNTGGFDTIEKLGRKITSGFAPSVLSANPSVILSQTSSYISAAYDIDPKYLLKALAGIGSRMKEIGERADKFSKIILARSFEEGAIRAQTNVDKINDVGKILGKGIEWTDRQICLLIFHAAEIQAASEGTGAIGTESNSKRAAEIADKTIQDTQAMSTPTEKSAWQRSPNLLARTVTLFTSDPMKQLSHLYSNVAKYTAHKKRVQMGDTSYEADLKQDLKGIGRSSATIIVNSAYLAAIAWLLRWAFNTDEDEPEEELQNILGDFVGNVIGIMPLVSDVYDLAIHDYSITPTAVDILNDTVTNTRDFISWNIDFIVNDKDISRKETFKTWKNFAKTITTFAGFPLDPILKTGSGIIRRFSPSSIYWYDSALSYNTYREDIDRAIAIGDDKLAQAALEMKYQEEATGTISDAEIAEILRLYQLKDEEGNFRDEVLPSSIPSEITTRKQRDKFESIYGESSGAVAKLINSLEYKNLTDEERIGAIKNTYKLYFNKAKTEVLGEKITSAQAYAMLLDDTSNLFLAQARKSSMKEYEDESGNTVTIKDQLSEYLKLLEVEDKERLVIEYALGYKSNKNRAALIEYINSLNLSQEEKEQIAERLGLDVKNGKIVEKTKE